MLNKTSLQQASTMCGESARDARAAFEKSISMIGRSGPLSPAQLPISIRRRMAIVAKASNEKQAVTDAARALAQLWKISPALVR